MHLEVVSKGVKKTYVDIPFLDYCIIRGKCVTVLHNHILADNGVCTIVVNVPDKPILWTYDTMLPYPATMEFRTDVKYTGGTPLPYNNKDLSSVDNLGLTGVFDPTVSDAGDLLDSTRYGAGSNPNSIVGASFGAGWFLLPPGETFMQRVTSHAAANNVVSRWTFLEL